MKIAILYICTGKYSIFWESFYKSSQKFFMPNSEKHYFVFTDNKDISETDTIHVKYEKTKGFPLDSLLRFDMFLTVKDELIKMDYVFFFNSNMQFVKQVDSEILPVNFDSGLVAVLHPGYFNKGKFLFPYERNKKSTCYIKYDKSINYNYFMGGLNGGKVKDFLKLSEICSENIHKDLNNGIMAIYHDESHINYYLNKKDILILTSDYGYPEDAVLPFEPKILILNKMKHGGKYFDKLPTKAYILRLFFKIKRIYFSIIWRFQ